MPLSETSILRALSSVIDPVTGRDLVSSGRVKQIEISADNANTPRVTLEIPRENAAQYTDLLEPMKQSLREAGATDPQVLLTAHQGAPSLKSAPKAGRGQPHKPRRPEGYQGDADITSILAISSAKGGVGKSTVAINLAYALARAGLSVGLLDADVHGPSLPLLTGLKGQRAPTVEVEGRTLIQPLTHRDIKVLSIGFLTKDDGPIVWRGPMVQGAITRMLWDAHWGALDVLLIDMPPGTGDAQLGLAQDIKPKGALVITTPQDLALEDARKGAQMFAKVDIPVIGNIINMSHFICPHCETPTDVFGSTDMESLAQIPLSLDIRRASEAHTPAAPEIFDALAAKLMEIGI